ncbi:MAG: hypothetical protein JKX85_08795, partial [Phycisphaeraceae bacterium]|nr:hypothetical protein [Phycisphaeraceae bacterium]
MKLHPLGHLTLFSMVMSTLVLASCATAEPKDSEKNLSPAFLNTSHPLDDPQRVVLEKHLATEPKPLGLDFKAYGFNLSSSEELVVQYQIAQAQSPPAATEYVLRNVRGNLVRQGQVLSHQQEPVKKGRIAKYRLMTRKDLAAVKLGRYYLRTRMIGGQKWFPSSFHLNKPRTTTKPSPKMAIAWLLDNMDSEGWGSYLTRNIDLPIENLNALRKSTPVDLAVVASRAKVTKIRRAEIQAYLQQGGKVLLFGNPSETWGDILPVHITRTQNVPLGEYSRQRNRFKVTAQGKSFFRISNQWQNKGHYHVLCKPLKNTQVLASYDDASPCLVLKKIGHGQVLYYNGELRPGLMQLDLLLSLSNFPCAPRKMPQLILPESPNTEGFSKNNIGRHGWVEGRSRGVSVVYSKNHFRIWDKLIFKVRFRDNSQPATRLWTEEANWVFRKNVFTGGLWGDRTEILSPLSANHMTFLPDANTRKLYLDLPTKTTGYRAVYLSPQGLTTLDLSQDTTINLADMSESWLLLHETTGQKASPILWSFTTQPMSVQRDDEQIILTFKKSPNAISFVPLHGIQSYSAETLNKQITLDDTLVDRCRFLARTMKAMPITCKENFVIKANTVQITNRYTYLHFPDQWHTKPLELAAIPPVVALARENKIPVDVQGKLTHIMPTFNGPFYALVDQQQVTYTLPRVDMDYPLQRKANPNPQYDATQQLLIDQSKQYINAWEPRRTFVNFQQ